MRCPDNGHRGWSARRRSVLAPKDARAVATARGGASAKASPKGAAPAPWRLPALHSPQRGKEKGNGPPAPAQANRPAELWLAFLERLFARFLERRQDHQQEQADRCEQQREADRRMQERHRIAAREQQRAPEIFL